MPIETPPNRTSERSALGRAQAGDEQAFRELISPYHGELHVHCYRLLGSLVDAEDLVQETLVAAWRALDSFAGRSSLRTWLYRIATNRCLNAIRDAKRRPPPEPVPPFEPPAPSRRGDVPWLQSWPDAWLEQVADQASGPEDRYQRRETIEMAFIVALQRLPPRQTAALLLCDVLDFSTAEAAEMLDKSPTAVKGLLQRARASLATQRGSSERGDLPTPGSAEESQLARRFASALVADDFGALVALLTDDAWLAMPPAPHEYHGAEAIVTFLGTSARWRGQRRIVLVPTRANTQPAFGYYLTDLDGATAQATGVLVLTMADDRINGITRFLDAGLPRLFGLPETVD